MCLFSILCSAKTTKQQQQQQQQSAATMPSKPAVTGKCQCFNNPTPLVSVAVECVCSLVYAAQCTRVPQEVWRSHAEHTASSYYAHPRKREDTLERAHAARLTAPTTQPTLWCHLIKPSHLNTGPPQQQLIEQLLLLEDRLETELQHLKLCLVGKKQAAVS